jgi:ketosteroid isomerase-like protein
MNNIEVVETAFEAFRSDPARMVGLLAEEFTFTSPQDDHIDKAAFVQRCLPAAGQITNHRTVHLVEAEGGNVFIMYEYTGSDGGTHRNTECLTVRDGLIVETQVFFGGRY